MAGYLWLVPGFGGSELYAQNPAGGRVKVWLDVPSLIRGDAPARLIYGSPLPGEAIVPGDPLSLLGFGYGGLMTAMLSAGAYGYSPKPWGYDWRMGALDLGGMLATAIVQQGRNFDHKIVCHSYGCLVVQVAMGLLTASPGGNPVSNVLAVAPPFSGTYSPCKAWRGEEDSMSALAFAANLGQYAINPWGAALNTVGNLLNPDAYITAYLQAFVSWPGTYDLLMNPDMADDTSDTNRVLAWDYTQWVASWAPPSSTLMAASRSGFQTTIRTGQYYPTFGKWMAVVGTDNATLTPVKMAPSKFPAASFPGSGVTGLGRRDFMPSMSYTNRGDNRASLESGHGIGLPWQIYALECRGPHADLQTHPGVLAMLLPLLNIPANSAWPFNVRRQWGDQFAGDIWRQPS